MAVATTRRTSAMEAEDINPFEDRGSSLDDASYSPMSSGSADYQIYDGGIDVGLTAACPYIMVPPLCERVYPICFGVSALVCLCCGIFGLVWDDMVDHGEKTCELAQSWIATEASVMIFVSITTLVLVGLHAMTLLPCFTSGRYSGVAGLVDKEVHDEHPLVTLSTALNFWHLIGHGVNLLWVIGWFSYGVRLFFVETRADDGSKLSEGCARVHIIGFAWLIVRVATVILPCVVVAVGAVLYFAARRFGNEFECCSRLRQVLNSGAPGAAQQVQRDGGGGGTRSSGERARSFADRRGLPF